MATPNDTGLPNTQDYDLGRGILYIAELDDTTGLPDTSGWRDLGNAPEFSVNVTEEELPHFSSREGIRLKDLAVTISREMSGSLSLDENSANNYAQWMDGALDTPSNPGVTGAAVVLTTSVVLGRHYEIFDQNGVRMRDIDVTNATITVRRDPSGTPETLVNNTDYVIEPVMGTIFFLSSPATGTFVAGDEVDINISGATTFVATVDRIKAFQTSDKRYALKFVAANPVRENKKSEYLWHQIRLKAGGDLSMIGDDWKTIPFNYTAEKNVNGDVLTIVTHDNAAD